MAALCVQGGLTFEDSRVMTGVVVESMKKLSPSNEFSALTVYSNFTYLRPNEGSSRNAIAAQHSPSTAQ